METPDTAEKALRVQQHVGAMLHGAWVKYQYLDRNPQPSGTEIEQWRIRQESQVYLYRIVPQSGDSTTVEVTLDAMRYGDPANVSNAVLDAQRAGRQARARIEWRADQLVTLWVAAEK
jgi:hypothetical protein